MNRRALLIQVGALVSASGALGKKKKKEEETQTLPPLRELPLTVSADVRRLAFHVTPLVGKGLLSQQIRDALKAAQRATGGAPMLKLRAFVAGTGDLRRVRDLVSSIFTDRRQPLPVLSLVQVGGLPAEGAQVALEVISLAKKPVNPHGLAFLSAEAAYADDPLAPVAPLAEAVRGRLREALRGARLQASDVLRITCYVSSLDHLHTLRGPLVAEYPRAATLFVQTRRAPDRAVAACEAVVRLPAPPPRAVTLLGPDGAAGESRAALVAPSQVVLTGTQVSFGYQESDARLAFGRLGKSLEQAGTSLREAVFAHYYPLSPGIASQVRKVRRDYLNPSAPPASTMVVLEGLPAMDAAFAVDVVAVKQ